ncbi:hypothetical protein N7G274_006907 [Stereocaulon virgatum]|uniref:Uncharacterized protein n=1 Tax=Stereocaulon virgatum TaxID=373712 RepID=A0ABR4A4N8_9LECA
MAWDSIVISKEHSSLADCRIEAGVQAQEHNAIYRILLPRPTYGHPQTQRLRTLALIHALSTEVVFSTNAHTEKLLIRYTNHTPTIRYSINRTRLQNHRCSNNRITQSEINRIQIATSDDSGIAAAQAPGTLASSGDPAAPKLGGEKLGAKEHLMEQLVAILPVDGLDLLLWRVAIRCCGEIAG